jgi:hypothetical protein
LRYRVWVAVSMAVFVGACASGGVTGTLPHQVTAETASQLATGTVQSANQPNSSGGQGGAQAATTSASVLAAIALERVVGPDAVLRRRDSLNQ